MTEDTLLRLFNLPFPLRILNIALLDCDLQVTLQATGRRARCPLCGCVSHRVHSRYQRTLADLPIGERQVSLVLCVPRFFGNARRCLRSIFCERLGEMALAYARRTTRTHRALQQIGMSDGGRAGRRLADSLHIPASRTTLLRLVRKSLLPSVPSLTALGIDDFAFRRGRNYGTILYDLNRHQVVDLLPDRSSQSLAQWLRTRPDIRIISRDRGEIYAQGAREGAPQAQQVADRWHLVDNLAEALTRFLSQHQSQLQAASVEVATVNTSVQQTPAPPSSPSTAAQSLKQSHRAVRLERFETIRKLHSEGHTKKEIAAHMGIHVSTVRRFVRAQHFPERAERRSSATQFAPFFAYLQKRWQEGCRDGRKILGELRQRGYTGSQSHFYRQLAKLREDQGLEPLTPAHARFSPRHVASVMLKQERKPEEQSLLERLDARSPLFHAAAKLADDFVGLVRKRTDQAESALECWVASAISSSIPSLVSFARGLREDWSAVVAGLTLDWSNGPVEGAVNRLKMIKRQMFGRANFDLLRCRVMSP